MVRQAVKLKKEAFQLELKEGCPDSFEKCRRARREERCGKSKGKSSGMEGTVEKDEVIIWQMLKVLDMVGVM